jgi:hypothetical protein
MDKTTKRKNNPRDLPMFKNLKGEVPAAEIRRILGVDSGNFQAYLSRDLLECETYTQGKRTYRRFFRRHVPFYSVVGSLLRLSIPIGTAVMAADTYLHYLDEAKAQEQPEYDYFITSEKVANFVTGDEGLEAAMENFHNSACILIHNRLAAKKVAAELKAIDRVMETDKESRRDDAHHG